MEGKGKPSADEWDLFPDVTFRRLLPVGVAEYRAGLKILGDGDVAVACDVLLRDFERTIAYLDVQEAAAKQGNHWEAKYLRTTSRLERLNRTLRRMVRQVVLFHREAGLDVRIYLTLMRAGELQIARGAKWSAVIEAALATA